MFDQVLSAYGFRKSECTIVPLGNGLINNTWLLSSGNKSYVLQRINERVFSSPQKISENIELIGDYLKKKNPAYTFVHPLRTAANRAYYHCEHDGYFRIFPFLEGSHTVDVVSTPQQAFEAAKQFGQFTKEMCDFDAGLLHLTLPDFHNLDLRYRFFLNALEKGSPHRIQNAKELIEFLKGQNAIVSVYHQITKSPEFRKRVTHHDTKISNVLFDKQDRGLCVIDLDTVMPGYFISDVGDMMRTYLSPVSEEEEDVSKIVIREDYFRAVAEGYLGAMNEELSPTEKKHFIYAGKFMIYMQAIRFLTDYLLNDIYYGRKSEHHNLHRALNQASLLKRLLEKEEALEKILISIIAEN